MNDLCILNAYRKLIASGQAPLNLRTGDVVPKHDWRGWRLLTQELGVRSRSSHLVREFVGLIEQALASGEIIRKRQREAIDTLLNQINGTYQESQQNLEQDQKASEDQNMDDEDDGEDEEEEEKEKGTRLKPRSQMPAYSRDHKRAKVSGTKYQEPSEPQNQQQRQQQATMHTAANLPTPLHQLQDVKLSPKPRKLPVATRGHEQNTKLGHVPATTRHDQRSQNDLGLFSTDIRNLLSGMGDLGDMKVQVNHPSSGATMSIVNHLDTNKGKEGNVVRLFCLHYEDEEDDPPDDEWLTYKQLMSRPYGERMVTSYLATISKDKGKVISQAQAPNNVDVDGPQGSMSRSHRQPMSNTFYRYNVTGNRQALSDSPPHVGKSATITEGCQAAADFVDLADDSETQDVLEADKARSRQRASSMRGTSAKDQGAGRSEDANHAQLSPGAVELLPKPIKKQCLEYAQPQHAVKKVSKINVHNLPHRPVDPKKGNLRLKMRMLTYNLLRSATTTAPTSKELEEDNLKEEEEDEVEEAVEEVEALRSPIHHRPGSTNFNDSGNSSPSGSDSPPIEISSDDEEDPPLISPPLWARDSYNEDVSQHQDIVEGEKEMEEAQPVVKGTMEAPDGQIIQGDGQGIQGDAAGATAAGSQGKQNRIVPSLTAEVRKTRALPRWAINKHLGEGIQPADSPLASPKVTSTKQTSSSIDKKANGSRRPLAATHEATPATYNKVSQAKGKAPREQGQPLPVEPLPSSENVAERLVPSPPSTDSLYVDASEKAPWHQGEVILPQEFHSPMSDPINTVEGSMSDPINMVEGSIAVRDEGMVIDGATDNNTTGYPKLPLTSCGRKHKKQKIPRRKANTNYVCENTQQLEHRTIGSPIQGEDGAMLQAQVEDSLLPPGRYMLPLRSIDPCSIAVPLPVIADETVLRGSGSQLLRGSGSQLLRGEGSELPISSVAEKPALTSVELLATSTILGAEGIVVPTPTETGAKVTTEVELASTVPIVKGNADQLEGADKGNADQREGVDNSMTQKKIPGIDLELLLGPKKGDSRAVASPLQAPELIAPSENTASFDSQDCWPSPAPFSLAGSLGVTCVADVMAAIHPLFNVNLASYWMTPMFQAVGRLPIGDVILEELSAILKDKNVRERSMDGADVLEMEETQRGDQMATIADKELTTPHEIAAQPAPELMSVGAQDTGEEVAIPQVPEGKALASELDQLRPSDATVSGVVAVSVGDLSRQPCEPAPSEPQLHDNGVECARGKDAHPDLMIGCPGGENGPCEAFKFGLGIDFDDTSLFTQAISQPYP